MWPTPAPESPPPNNSSKPPRRSATKPKPTTSKRKTISAATSNSWTNRKFREQQYDQAVAAAKANAAAVDAARAIADAAQSQVDQAQGKLVQAEANWRNAQTAPKQMQVIRSTAASAEAQAQQKKADLDQAPLNLQYTKIIAPVAGVVSDRTVEVGQNVAPGQELMKVIPLNDVWITANFKETQLREMKVGQPRHH